MFRVLRPFHGMGAQRFRGEVVDAESWRNRDALVSLRHLERHQGPTVEAGGRIWASDELALEGLEAMAAWDDRHGLPAGEGTLADDDDEQTGEPVPEKVTASKGRGAKG